MFHFWPDATFTVATLESGREIEDAVTAQVGIFRVLFPGSWLRPMVAHRFATFLNQLPAPLQLEDGLTLGMSSLGKETRRGRDSGGVTKYRSM